MNLKNLRLLLLLIVLALSNMAPSGEDLIYGFLFGEDPGCDCEEENTAKIELSPAKVVLTQGESASVQADFLLGSEAKSVQWGMRRPRPSLIESVSGPNPGRGATTHISLTAASNVIPDSNWEMGSQYEEDSPTVSTSDEGGASAVLSITVWGTQLYWANEDGSVRRWWDSVRESFVGSIPFSGVARQRTYLRDGGDTVSYYLKLNVPGGASSEDWDFKVQLRPVREATIVDNIVPVYDPFASEGDPSNYIEKPTVTIENGVAKVTFKTKQDFPQWSFSGSSADMPFEVVAKRKSDDLTVKKQSSLRFFDRAFHL